MKHLDYIDISHYKYWLYPLWERSPAESIRHLTNPKLFDAHLPKMVFAIIGFSIYGPGILYFTNMDHF